MSRDKVREIVQSAGYCQMATSVDGQPRVRPMKFVITDDFKFWCSTFVISGKMKEFEQNAQVELCWVDQQKNHLRVTGSVDVSSGPEKKRELLRLHPGAKGLFKDEYDPNLVLVEVTPSRVRWKEHSFGEYHEVE
ncbi:pyridoxamine 5'-phosphate oxidase family protein [Alkalispirochaeta americana]|nr:pyridoxamine 5'-phosphate oxidase family protein [Alkalispirochaeta americana]